MVIIFITVVIAKSGIKLVQIMDIPTIMYLIVGLVVVTIIEYKSNISRYTLLKKAMRNCLILGVVGFFIGLFSALLNTSSIDTLLKDLKISVLMIPYTAILYLMLHIYTRNRMLDSMKTGEGIEKIKHQDICKKYNLTGRESEIVEKLLIGISNNQIAEELYITENTVKKHTSIVYAKMGVKNRNELICWLKDIM